VTPNEAGRIAFEATRYMRWPRDAVYEYVAPETRAELEACAIAVAHEAACRERAAIVAWLRSSPLEAGRWRADAIERGEHHGE
jgi:hypothetical protein